MLELQVGAWKPILDNGAEGMTLGSAEVSQTGRLPSIMRSLSRAGGRLPDYNRIFSLICFSSLTCLSSYTLFLLGKQGNTLVTHVELWTLQILQKKSSCWL